MSWDHFTEAELSCHGHDCCGGESKMDPVFMEQLVMLREHADFPFVVTSAYRCEKHNTEIGGYKTSRHVEGKAVDILCYGDNAHKLLALARRYNMNGIGVSQRSDFGTRFLHLDGRDKSSVWSY